MPIIVPKDIPAAKILAGENIFVMNDVRAATQDIRPLEIAVLNLMPTKIVTETQLMRLLSNSPLQVNITLLATQSYVGKNTPISHLDRFYSTFEEVKHRRFDGMIITGAPVEDIEFGEVKYWDELAEVFEFVKTNVTSTMFICWGAQAGLHYYYGVEKQALPKKLFGIYRYYGFDRFEPLLKGLDDGFAMPHSRHTTIEEKDIRESKDLVLLASSEETGPAIVRSVDNRFIFILGHPEYDRDTLEKEYLRDLEKGLPIEAPEHYYREGKGGEIDFCWSSTANLLYTNWLNHYVYQITPYDWK